LGLKTKKKTSYVVPDGTYDAVLVGIYDLGTQVNEMYKKEQEKVLFVWELIDEDRTEPLTISRFYTLSHHAKSTLRHDLEAILGRSFTKEEDRSGIDLRTLLGATTQVQVITESINGKDRSKIKSIMKPRDHRNITPKNTLTYYDMNESLELPEGTPDWIAEIILRSREFNDGTPVSPDNGKDHKQSEETVLEAF
jgi:hypothetical protein